MKIILLTISTISLLLSLDMQSPKTKATLLELFTSEGCSSCPPADKWVNTFKDSKLLFKKIIPVVFHVDYWDRLGWVDKFAKKEYTKRQYSYSNAWRSSSVYTPGFVVNGKEHKRWYYSRTPPISNENVGILKVNLQGENLKVVFNGIQKTNKKVFLEVSIMGMNYKSKVTAGENNGEFFTHDFVNIALDTYKVNLKNGKLQQTISFPNFKKEKNRQYAIAIWLSEVSSKKVIQAVGSYF